MRIDEIPGTGNRDVKAKFAILAPAAPPARATINRCGFGLRSRGAPAPVADGWFGAWFG